MTIAVKLLNDQIKKVSDTNTLLDMLLEFEKYLDEIDLYVYKNWNKGEVLEGPNLGRHYVSLKLMYPHEDMPDPEGAKRILKNNGLVKYTKDTLISPVEVKGWSDVTTEARPDGSTRTKAKTKSEPVWVVDIQIPRKYVDEFSSDAVEVDEDEYIDTESLGAEQQIAAQQQIQGN